MIQDEPVDARFNSNGGSEDDRVPVHVVTHEQKEEFVRQVVQRPSATRQNLRQ